VTDSIAPTKALVPPPSRAAKRGIMASVPQLVETPSLNNMQKVNSGFQDMNFKVDPNFHLRFKAVATVKGMPMKDLLEASFGAWLEKYGDAQTKAVIDTLPPL
jgi:hypothetical protein